MPESKWNNKMLEAMRHIGDPPADQLIHDIFEKHEELLVNKAFQSLLQNDQTVPSVFPPEVAEFLNHTAVLPPWYDPVKVQHGEEMYNTYGAQVALALLCASLPKCYGMANGVNVLYISKGLTQHVERHLIETQQFLLDVMAPGGLAPQGHGLRAAQRLRLFHTAMRYLIPRQATWNPAWGVPICQEDMAFTLLTFSLVILESLEKLGITVSKEQQEGYFHAWNCVGYVIGIKPELMANDLAEGKALFELIAQQQYGPCEANQALTLSLVDFLEHIMPGTLFRGLPAIAIRHLCGEKLSDMLQVPQSKSTDVFLKLCTRFSHLEEELLGDDKTLRDVLTIFSSKLMEALEWVARDGKRVPFAMPPSLRDEWKVN